MDKTTELLKHLKWESEIEFNNLTHKISYKDCVGASNVYFVAGLGEKISKRASDDDIKTKKYLCVDIDIRMDHYDKTKEVLSQEELDLKSDYIISLLNKSEFADYCWVVKSGNWLHIYYSGKERSFDKQIYANWVKYVYHMINEAIRSSWFICDPACHNLARIMRVPWSMNPRLKKKKENGNDVILWDMWPYECNVVEFIDRESQCFGLLEELWSLYQEDEKKHKEDLVIVKDIVKNEHKKSDKIWEEINNVPAYEIAIDMRWVSLLDKGLDNVALSEWHKNMWAYWYKPHNVIVNTWSSLIKHKTKKTFTTYELVYFEMCNENIKETLEYFEKKYGIKSKQEEKKEKIVIEQTTYEKQWYIYPSDIFDPFDCIMSWELVTIVARSNSGKTTFAMDIIQANANIWKKWFYINLEFNIRTVWESKWLFLNGKKKRNLTDIDPLSDNDKANMNKYVDDMLKKFDYYNAPDWLDLNSLVELIKKKYEEWYWLMVLDTFSRIKWNLESSIAHTSQNKSMETLQELCQKIWVALISLHHTNKKWEFEWSQKIMDLSNVFITMMQEEQPDGNKKTIFDLSKDKFVTSTIVESYYIKKTYSKEPPEIDKPF